MPIAQPRGPLSPAAKIWPALLRGGAGSVAFMAETDASPLQVVRRHFHDDAVAYTRSNAEFAHLARRVSEDLMVVIEFHPKIAIGQNLGDRPVKLEQLFFRHPFLSGCLSWAGGRRCGAARPDVA